MRQMFVGSSWVWFVVGVGEVRMCGRSEKNTLLLPEDGGIVKTCLMWWRSGSDGLVDVVE
jgi:hypothetical protein